MTYLMRKCLKLLFSFMTDRDLAPVHWGDSVWLTLKNYKRTSTTNKCWDRTDTTEFIANVHKLTSERALSNMGNTTKYGYDKFTKIIAIKINTKNMISIFSSNSGSTENTYCHTFEVLFLLYLSDGNNSHTNESILFRCILYIAIFAPTKHMFQDTLSDSQPTLTQSKLSLPIQVFD